jgi:hypothetical protein
MKLQTILTEQHLEYSRTILRESCDGLTTYQRTIVEGIYKDSLPLIEATLTAAQIEQLFGEVEKSATAGGGNRTGLGKGIDVAKKADETINKIGKWLQNTTPVKGFDQKFEDLKTKIGTKFPELDKKLTAMGTWAKENPGKTAAIVGVLTTIASFAGGPVGGAIAGQVLRGAVELLKGEKLSTAIGKGIKTAALGYLSGKAFEVLGKFVGGMRADSIPFPGAEDSGLAQVSYGATRTLTAPGISSSEMVQGFNVTVFPQDQEAINQAMQAIRYGQAGGFDTLRTIAREIQSADYKSAIKDIVANARADQLANDGLMNWIKGMSTAGQALSQGAVAAAGVADGDKKQPAKESWERNYYVQTRPLTEGQVGYMFKQIQLLNEGPMDWIKKKAGNLTTKVTADKLMSAWKKAGSPTDSNEVAEFLKGQGIVDDTVAQVYQTMKLPSPGTAEQPAPEALSYKQVLDLVNKLPVDRKVRLMKFIEKTKNTEPTAKGTVDNSKTKPTTA